MDPFNHVFVYPNYKKGHFIQWELNPTLKVLSPLNFTVQISENENFTDILISKDVGNSYYAIDDTHLKQSLSFNYIYRIKLTTGSGKVFYSRPIWAHNTPDTKQKFQMACEIMRIEQYVTQRFTGRKMYFFKRRAFGEIDQSAIDPVTGAVIADNESNQGSKFKHGFYEPVLTSFRILSSDESRDFDEGGKGTVEPFRYQVKMIGFPRVEQDDLFVSVDDSRRYTVQRSKNYPLPGSNYVTSQRLDIAAVPVTDPLYLINIPCAKQKC